MTCQRSVSLRWRSLVSLVGCLPCLLALPSGFALDDYFLAARVMHPDGSPRALGLLDAFGLAGPGEVGALRELGALPWWADDAFQVSFLRPLAALTHMVDFALFPQQPWLMHLESIGILFLLNLAVATWNARLFAAPRTAQLATWLYLLAPGHAFAASWLANRNGCLAALFAVGSLLAHARFRATHRAHYAWLSALALALALCSGEAGAWAVALVGAYTLTLDQGPVRARLLGIAPALVLAGLWLFTRRALGFGVVSEVLYLDPQTSLLAYAASVPQRLAILLFAVLGIPIASLTVLLSRQALLLFAALAASYVALLLANLWPILRQARVARFFLVSMVLSLLPVAATVPHDRLTLIADAGGAGLLALAAHSGDMRSARGAPRLLWLCKLRLTLGPLLAALYVVSLYRFEGLTRAPFQQQVAAAADEGASLVFVNAPCVYFVDLWPRVRAYEQRPVPQRLRALAPGIYPLALTARDAHTLVLQADSGILQPIGSHSGFGTNLGAVAPAYMAQALDQFSGPMRAFKPGDQVVLSDVAIRIEAVSPTGLATRVSFRFALPLSDPRQRFFAWRDNAFVAFELPQPGQTVRLEPILE